MFTLEPPRKPDRVPVDDAVQVRDRNRHIGARHPAILLRIVDIDTIRGVQLRIDETSEHEQATFHDRGRSLEARKRAWGDGLPFGAGGRRDFRWL